jgi:hypothetical protein
VELQEITMKRRISISFDLGENRRYDSFFRRLHALDAFPVMSSQWVTQTPFTVEQIERDLRRYIDPADRLLVSYCGAMSSRNPINPDRFASGSA